MKTKSQIEHLIDVYEWSISTWSDISLYGPPTQHQHYRTLYDTETREESLRNDLIRLAELRAELLALGT